MLVCCALLASTILGCGAPTSPAIGVPEQLTLYSIDGRDVAPGKEPKAEEEFHGYPVLGKIEVKQADHRNELVAALNHGMVRSDMLNCFWPRHAIRAVQKGRTIDYVICFKCYQLQIHDGSQRTTKPITRDPQSVFNKHLKQAGIPLAPGMAGDQE